MDFMFNFIGNEILGRKSDINSLKFFRWTTRKSFMCFYGEFIFTCLFNEKKNIKYIIRTAV